MAGAKTYEILEKELSTFIKIEEHVKFFKNVETHSTTWPSLKSITGSKSTIFTANTKYGGKFYAG